MSYKIVYKCKKCEGRLIYDQVMGTGGVCPLCGVVSDGTIIPVWKTSEEYEPPKDSLWVIFAILLVPIVLIGGFLLIVLI